MRTLLWVLAGGLLVVPCAAQITTTGAGGKPGAAAPTSILLADTGVALLADTGVKLLVQ